VAVTVRLDPDLEKALQARAQAAGLTLERYVEILLQNQISILSSGWKLNGQELEFELDALAAYSEKIPLLPLTALKREGIYQDHE